MNKPLLVTLLLTSTLGLSAFASASGNSSSFSQSERPAMNSTTHEASTSPAQQLQVTPFSQRERDAMDNQSAKNKTTPANHAAVTPFLFREHTAG
jgi:hypothetical protein